MRVRNNLGSDRKYPAMKEFRRRKARFKGNLTLTLGGQKRRMEEGGQKEKRERRADARASSWQQLKLTR